MRFDSVNPGCAGANLGFGGKRRWRFFEHRRKVLDGAAAWRRGGFICRATSVAGDGASNWLDKAGLPVLALFEVVRWMTNED
jgi:hypothetical protein